MYANEKTGGSIIGSEGSGDNGIYGLLIRLAEGVNNAIDLRLSTVHGQAALLRRTLLN